MKTCTSCGRTVADDDGLALTDGSFYCKSGGCQKRFLDSVVDNQVIPDIIRSGGRVVKFVDEGKPAPSSALPGMGGSPAESNRECELCHKIQVEGCRYYFYYGKKTDTSIFDFLLKLRGISSPPLIKDRGSAWICRKCTNLRKTTLYGLMAILLLVSVPSLIVIFSNPSALDLMSLTIAAVGFWSLGIFFIMFDRLRGKNEITERLAIRLKKKELRKQGYKVFLTNRQFAKLR